MGSKPAVCSHVNLFVGLEKAKGVNSIGTSHEIYFASWNIDILKTKNHVFKSACANTGQDVDFVDVDMNSSGDTE